jgi:putative phosphoribosyl transferase
MGEKPGMEVVIPAGAAKLPGILNVPPKARGIVVFAHGSGSGRFSPRNRFVAQVLQESGLATLLSDLLEEWEASDRRKVFDMDLLTNRLLANAHFLRKQPRTQKLPLGYFGASTGAGAALQAAAREPAGVAAIVSRGGRPDLALDYLPLVQAPTLLIVGGEDELVISLNEKAHGLLRCTKKLKIVPGASHLFEEPGTLEQVAESARDWFLQYALPEA